MKLNTAKKSLESSGMNINVDFTIDMNGKAFNVLSDGMYSDVITTIVRELSSNAYDAHIAAGKKDVPFEVSCPSAFDPHFAVKDFGTGLRYYKYNARITNEHEGESTIFIEGDVREVINGINLIVLNECETVRIGAILYDNSAKQTVIRIPDNYEGENVAVEFDDALVLYSTYFRSTKEQSNDYIGAFGLGSKTPFAYTDNFLVINRFDGVERTYNILTNSDSKPQINLMSSTATDEGNGLEVKLAVSPDDYSEFKEAICSQLVYFDPRPTICNDPVEFATVVHRGKHFLLMDGDLPDVGGDYWNRRARATVGNNAYGINGVDSNLFKSGNLVLRFNVGEVMVTASREELKYDDTTTSNIKTREKEAIAEYTQYVLDRLDDDGMTDYEKATFLNHNSTVIDLSLDSVKKKVGNPHYSYRKNGITIPIAGWGDYSVLKEKEFTEQDDSGNFITYTKLVDSHNSTAMRWSEYNTSTNKTVSIDGNQRIRPDQKLLVFIRDNSYSFLKKISYYREQNDPNVETILVLDLFRADDTTSLDALKGLIGHTTTFVYLSSIDVPKTTYTYAPSDRSPTPTARKFTPGTDEIHSDSKMWDEIYNPLTKIDTDAYIIESHRCVFEGVSRDDLMFLDRFFRGSFEYDPDLTILAMSRAKYAKALEYGFKPISELIKELKETVTIPVDLVNYRAISQAWGNFSRNRMVEIFGYISDDELKGLNKKTSASKAIRLKKIMFKRYIDKGAKFNALDQLANWYDEKELPEVSPVVKKAVDMMEQLCDNMYEELVLVRDSYAHNFGGEAKRKALIQYANMVHEHNTGEDNE